MSDKSLNYDLFSGLVFWGSEYLPHDVILSLSDIRKWAFKKKMIWEPESQLIGKERLDELNKHFVSEDQLSILFHLYKDDKNNLCYLEYPYMSVKTLIKKDKQIEIVYWQLLPKLWDAGGTPKNYEELHFSFWYPDIPNDEFVSMSFAKLIVKKYYDLYQNLSNEYETKILNNGTLDITVNGAIKAKFFKTGRLFDVELKY